MVTQIYTFYTFFTLQKKIYISSYSKRTTSDLQTVVIWKMNSPTDVQWDSIRTLPPMTIASSRFFMDKRFFVILIEHSSSYTCDARKIIEPGKKGRLIKIPKTRPEILYCDGFLITVNMRNNIV